jgi:PAS domain S-box-containing protein
LDESAGFFSASSTPTAVIGHDGELRRVNPAWSSVLGKPSIGASWLEHVVSTDRAVLTRALLGVREGVAAEVRLALKRDDGSAIGLSCELSPVAGQDFFYCAARPITLSADEGDPLLGSVLRALDETEAIGFCLVSGTPRRPRYANAVAGRIWEIPDFPARVRAGTVTYDELRSQYANLVADPRAFDVARAELLAEPGRREFELLLKDGRTVVWVVLPVKDERGARVGELYVSRDITKLKGIEQELAMALERQRSSEATFRRLVELVPDGITVFRDGRIVYANPASARLIGGERGEDLIGMHFTSLVPPQDLPDTAERLGAMTGDKPLPPNVRRFVRLDGTTGFANTIGFPIELDGGPATLTIVKDVTEELRLESQIRQAERLASLGTLSAAIAHEINNPLAYILLNLHAIRRWLGELAPGDHSPVVQKALELIEQSLEGAERVRVIVRDLRGFARADDSENTNLDVREVIDSVIGMADHEIRQRATLVRHFDDVPLVRASEPRLGQVFLNLIVNAAHAIPEGQPGHEIHVATFTSGSDVVVTVRDTGEGMTPEIRERVFEPFFTSKGPAVGTGLGLSLCLGIVQALGGNIGVESTVGEGSTFRVTLPAAPERSTPESKTAVSLAVPRSKILIVDDEPRIATRLAELLEEHDLTVVTNGRDAVARLREDRFDVVFCDLMMPDLKGTDVFEMAVAEEPRLQDRFIFMTAGAFAPSARALLDRVSTPRLDKPFNEVQVRNVLALVLAGPRPGERS